MITVGNVVSWCVTIGIGIIIIGLVKTLWKKQFENVVTQSSLTKFWENQRKDLMEAVMRPEDCIRVHKELTGDIKEIFQHEIKGVQDHFDMQIKNQVLTLQKEALLNQQTFMTQITEVLKVVKKLDGNKE